MRLTYALLFHDRGIPIIPCYRESKAILSGYGPHRDKPADPTFLFRWIKEQDNNYALAAGHAGLVVLDFDDPSVYQTWINEVGPELSDTFTVATSRGWHVYYRSDDLRSWKAQGVEVLAHGKAVMGPYSIHPDGDLYLPINPPEIRFVSTVSDFPILSNSRPITPEPPEKPPERLNPSGQGLSPVKRIKSTWSILDGLQILWPDSYKTLKGAGRWRSALCPFHDDNHASLWIDTERNIFGCHACGVHGDVINLVASSVGCTPGEAIRLILRSGSLIVQGVKA